MAQSWVKSSAWEHVISITTSRRGRWGLVIITGVSLSILAGFLLSLRRRRYRPVSSRRALTRENTFRPTNSTQRMQLADENIDESQETLSQDALLPQDSLLDTPPMLTPPPESGSNEDTEYETGSDTSDDSFHSTTDVISPMPKVSVPNALYQEGSRAVSRGDVTVRTMRTKMLGCSSDNDFLAKAYCVRLAFDHLLSSPQNISYFSGIARGLMSDFLESAGENSQAFVENFDEIISFMRDSDSWDVAVKELTVRRVGAMNVYDIAVDFILLDAFDDLEAPPSAFVSVLQNRWITAGMKRSALSAALWSVLKAKRGMLKHKRGFMSHFYSLSETLTPTLAWGFLGTDDKLKATCARFKEGVLGFVRDIFSAETVHYSTVNELSQDILQLAQALADDMREHNL